MGTIRQKVKLVIKEPVAALAITSSLFHLSLIHFLVKSHDPSENQRNSYQVFLLKYRGALGRFSIFEKINVGSL